MPRRVVGFEKMTGVSESDVSSRPAESRGGGIDAILLLSFGGPETDDEVVPFLENVTRGTGIPRSRLAQVGEHYYLFGGRSPINDQNRALIDALHERLGVLGHDLPIYWGNRNWRPFVKEAVERIVADGRRRVRIVVTSAYPSYSGCRSYREDMAAAIAEVPGAESVSWERIGHYGLDDGFVDTNADALRAALDRLPGARVVFVTHSIPTPMNETSGPQGHAYLSWHEEVARRIALRVPEADDHDLVFCSRSGRPGQPWLEPDVNDHLRRLAESGVTSVVLAPIGFVSDHMEVIYDLDTQARQTCRELGIRMERAATAGVTPAFVNGLVDRILADLDRPGAVPGECRTPCTCDACCANLQRADTPAIA